jgi:hypothetical protein
MGTNIITCCGVEETDFCEKYTGAGVAYGLA